MHKKPIKQIEKIHSWLNSLHPDLSMMIVLMSTFLSIGIVFRIIDFVFGSGAAFFVILCFLFSFLLIVMCSSVNPDGNSK